MNREAIRLDPGPGSAEARNNLGNVLKEQGDLAGAIEEYRRALGLGDLAAVLFNLADALDAAGRRAEAIPLYQRFVDEHGREHPSQAELARHRLATLRSR